jgi:hypothetical protein
MVVDRLVWILPGVTTVRKAESSARTLVGRPHPHRFMGKHVLSKLGHLCSDLTQDPPIH